MQGLGERAGDVGVQVGGGGGGGGTIEPQERDSVCVPPVVEQFAFVLVVGQFLV